MLAATRRHFARQKRLLELAQADTMHAAKRGSRSAAHMIVTYQAANITLALRNIDEMLAEQGLANDPEGTVDAASLLSAPGPVALMAQATDSPAALGRLATTLVADAARTATGVGMAARRNVTVYVRSVGGACCSRCAVLSGRVYRWSDDFKRHPNCLCTMLPTTYADAYGLGEPSPEDLFHEGRITDLTRAQTQAINDGADIRQIVNATQRLGLSSQSSVIVRGERLNFTLEGTTKRGVYGGYTNPSGGYTTRDMGQRGYVKHYIERRAKQGRLTPETIYRVARNREDVIRLLKKYGYILPF